MSDDTMKKLWENPANPELEVALQSAEAANVCTAGTRELTPEEARALTVSGPFPEDASPAVAASSQREAAPSAPSSKASFEQHFMARFLDDRAFADAVTAYLVSLDGGEEEETLDSEVPGQMVMEEFANEGKGRQSVRRRGTNITI